MREASSTPPASRACILIPGLLVLVWCLLQLAGDPRFFWTDDFQVAYLPYAEEIVRSWREGEWPILSKNSWCSGNLAGEYQFGTFSPALTLLFLAIWSLPLSLPGKAAAIAIAHLVWMATGVFLLGRHRGLNVPLATMAALATSLSGWLIQWAATNWASSLTGAAWVPWVWWSLQTAMTATSVWQRWWRPALCVALLVTAGGTFAVLMVPVIAGWLGAQAIFGERNWRRCGPLVAALVLGVGLSAPAWWLLLEQAQDSTRWDWGLVVQKAWVVPWRAWPGLVLPSFVTPWPQYSSEYFPHTSLELACGLVPVAALVAALIFHPKALRRTLRWELLLLAICVLLVSLPSIGQFRWSFRWLPLFHLVLALTAAAACQNGFASRAPLCGMVLVGATWAGATWCGANRSITLAASLLGIAITWWIAQRFLPRRWVDWSPAAVVALTLGATFWNLSTHEPLFQAKFSFDENILQPAPLDGNRLYLSLYSFNEISQAHTRPRGFGTLVRPANAMHYAGLRFLNGYSSYSGRDVQALFETHGDVSAERAEWLAGRDGERLLLFLGVDGMVFSSEYAHFAERLGPEWKKVAETSEGIVFHREPARFLPIKTLTFLFDRPGVPLADPVIQIIAERRTRVTVEITPGALKSPASVAPIAFVRPYLRGYRAYFNGAPVPVRAYRNILPLVELPADARGTLELRYRPRGLIYGAILTSASLVVMLIIAIFARNRAALVQSVVTSAEKT